MYVNERNRHVHSNLCKIYSPVSLFIIIIPFCAASFQYYLNTNATTIFEIRINNFMFDKIILFLGNTLQGLELNTFLFEINLCSKAN